MLVSFSETEAEVIFFQFTAIFYRDLENNIARLFCFKRGGSQKAGANTKRPFSNH